MPHVYVSQLIHCVFATKNREPFIVPGFRERLHAYIGGIAQKHRFCALAVGGIEDHVHVLLSLPATVSVSKAVQLIKGGSSHWVHETFPERMYFQWQEGYGAFSLGISHLPKTRTYIERQKEHHQTVDYQQELREILNKHGLDVAELGP
jgi:REP element-mobilizing transposase RayT